MQNHVNHNVVDINTKFCAGVMKNPGAVQAAVVEMITPKAQSEHNAHPPLTKLINEFVAGLSN
jgi:hypothetical protein